ncbi:hypothetical protein BH09BAC2_BH09BAC2_22470 [soil metagenome]
MKYFVFLFTAFLIQHTAAAQCATPSAPTSLFLSATDTQISVYFDSTATASEYLAIISLSPSLSAAPVNGTVYALNSSLGGGNVFYKGNNYEFRATGLTSNLKYYFFIYSYKTGCAGEPSYSTSSLNGNITTFNSAPGIPAGYYNAATGLTCSTLKTALFNIVKPTIGDPLPTYKGLLGAQQLTDGRMNDNATKYILWDQYSDNPAGAEPYEFTFGSPYLDKGTGGTLEGQRYNREHIFPQAWFSSSEPMYSDIFIVFPSDKKVNSIRANNPYGKVGTASYTSSNGSKSGNNVYSPVFTGTVFEPVNAYKGDIARENLYVITAYEDKVAGWQTNSNANDVLAGNAYPAFDDWFIKLLYDWHVSDPVSQKEIDRNNTAYMIQGNRNPFVDHPEYVALMLQCTGAIPVTLINFTAIKNDNNVVLHWYATREKNFKNYEVQRSNNGIDFYNIGVVDAKNLGNYYFKDADLPNINKVYYRLRLVDIDGHFDFSSIASVKLNNNFSNAVIYPNPASGQINIQLPEVLEEQTLINVFDAIGNKVKTLNAAKGESNINVSVSNLSAGRYFINFSNHLQIFKKSFVIVR